MNGASHKPVIIKSIFAAIVMFLFAIFVLPPLYDLFCEITGIGGKTSGPYQAERLTVDETRLVEVQFVVTNNATMPWEFYPVKEKVFIHPGEPKEISYYAKNLTGKDMIGQAIPNILPNNAADYFHKTECFCFEQQFLEAGESITIPVKFIIDPELPKDIPSLALGYTLFDVTEEFANLQAID